MLPTQNGHCGPNYKHFEFNCSKVVHALGCGSALTSVALGDHGDAHASIVGVQLAPGACPQNPWTHRCITQEEVMTLSAGPADSTQSTLAIRVLILEDDEVLCERVLVPRLSQFGFDASAVSSFAQMQEVIVQRAPDLVVLDIGLPDVDGFEVARRLRKDAPGIGIVMLTGRSENDDRVRGLMEGGDAYLSKPVEIDVLVATLHSVARRLQILPDEKKGGWKLSADGWLLHTPGGASVRLSKAERQLMEALVKWPNEAMPRETLFAALADDLVEFDPHRLESLIHRLRRKTLSSTGDHLPLAVVRGVGYVFQG